MLDFRKNLLNQSTCCGTRIFPECREALSLGSLPEDTLCALCPSVCPSVSQGFVSKSQQMRFAFAGVTFVETAPS